MLSCLLLVHEHRTIEIKISKVKSFYIRLCHRKQLTDLTLQCNVSEGIPQPHKRIGKEQRTFDVFKVASLK